MKKIFCIIVSVFVLASCSKVAKKRLGIDETLPDEFQVLRTDGLEVPPHLKLNKSPAKQNSKATEDSADKKKASEEESEEEDINTE